MGTPRCESAGCQLREHLCSSEAFRVATNGEPGESIDTTRYVEVRALSHHAVGARTGSVRRQEAAFRPRFRSRLSVRNTSQMRALRFPATLSEPPAPVNKLLSAADNRCPHLVYKAASITER